MATVPRSPLASPRIVLGSSVDLLTWINSITPRDGGAQPPNSLLDQPNPVLPIVGRQDFWLGFNPDLFPVTTQPTTQLDWPNPPGPQYPIELRTWIRHDPIPFDGGAQPQNSLLDQPNPILGIVRRQDFYDSNVTLRVTPPVGRDTQAPNPRGPQFPSQFDWSNGFSLPNAPVTGTPPNALYDWPNPYGPMCAVDLLTWIQTPAIDNIPAGVTAHGVISRRGKTVIWTEEELEALPEIQIAETRQDEYNGLIDQLEYVRGELGRARTAKADISSVRSALERTKAAAARKSSAQAAIRQLNVELKQLKKDIGISEIKLAKEQAQADAALKRYRNLIQEEEEMPGLLAFIVKLWD